MPNTIENETIKNLDQEADVDKEFGFTYGYTQREQIEIPYGRGWTSPEEVAAREEGMENIDEHEKQKLQARDEVFKPKDTYGRAIREIGQTVKEGPSILAESLQSGIKQWPSADQEKPFTRDDYKFYDRIMTDMDRKNLGENIRKMGDKYPDLNENQRYELAFRETIKHYGKSREDLMIKPLEKVKDADIFKKTAEFTESQSSGLKQDVGAGIGSTVVIAGSTPLTLGASTYMYAQGMAHRDIRKQLDKVYPLMGEKDKEDIAFMASSTIGLATAPMEGIGNILQIRAFMGGAAFRRVATKWFSATIGEGITEYVQQAPEAMVMLRTLNPDLTPQQFEEYVKEMAPQIRADALKAGLVGTLSGGIVAGAGSGVNITMKNLSKYISKEQARINENKNITEEQPGVTINDVLGAEEVAPDQEIEEIEITDQDLEALRQLDVAQQKAIEEGKPFSINYDVEAKQFVKSTRENFRPWMLTQKSAAELHNMITSGEVKMFNLPGRDAGYGITTDKHETPNQLVLFHSNKDPKSGAGRKMIEHAIANGANNLEVYDLHGMVDFYKKFGFEEVDRAPFSEEYADPNWDYENQGKPDYVVMRLSEESHIRWMGKRRSKKSGKPKPKLSKDEKAAKLKAREDKRKAKEMERLRQAERVKNKVMSTVEKAESLGVYGSIKRGREILNKTNEILKNEIKLHADTREQYAILTIDEEDIAKIEAKEPGFREEIESRRADYKKVLKRNIKVSGRNDPDAKRTWAASLEGMGIEKDIVESIGVYFDAIGEASVKRGDIDNLNDFYAHWFPAVKFEGIEEALADAEYTFGQNRSTLDPKSAREMSTEIVGAKGLADGIHAVRALPRVIKIFNVASLVEGTNSLRQLDMETYRLAQGATDIEHVIQTRKATEKKIKDIMDSDAVKHSLMIEKDNPGLLRALTYIHETGHILQDFLAVYNPELHREVAEEMGFTDAILSAAKDQTLDPVTQNDMADVFADSWLRYIITGKAQGPKQKTAFERIKAWLVGMYEKWHNVRDFLDRPINKEFYKYFDYLMGGDLAPARAKAEETAQVLKDTSDFIESSPGAQEYVNKKFMMTDHRKNVAGFVERRARHKVLKDIISGAERLPGSPLVSYPLNEDGNFQTGTLDQTKRGLLGDQTVLSFTLWNPKHGAPVPASHQIDWGMVTNTESMNTVMDVVRQDNAEYLDQASQYYNFLEGDARAQYVEDLNSQVSGLGDVVAGVEGAMLPGIAKQVNSTSTELGRIFGPDSTVNQVTYADMLKRKSNDIANMLEMFGDKQNSREDQEAISPMLYKTMDHYYAMMNQLLGHDDIAKKTLGKWQLEAPTAELRTEEFEKKRANLPTAYETKRLSGLMQGYVEKGKTGLGIQKFKAYGLSDVFKEVAFSNMLSAPTTHAINLGVNTLNLGMDMLVERPAAVVFGMMYNEGHTLNKSTDRIPVKEAFWNVGGFFGGFYEMMKALYLFSSDPTMSTPAGAISKVVTSLDVDENAPKDIDRRVITSEAWRNSTIGGYLAREARRSKAGEVTAEFLESGIDNIGAILRLPSNMLGIGDKVFLDYLGYRMALNAHSMRLAWQQGKQLGWNSKQVNEQAEWIKDNPEFYKLDQKNISQSAVDQAKVWAFRSDPEGYSRTFIDWMRNADRFGAWLTLPFRNTLMNIHRDQLKRVPMLHMYMEDYKNKSDAEKALADSKMFVTTMGLSVILWTLMNEPPEEKRVVEGIQFPKLTGKGPPKGSPQRKRMEALGWKEYSLRTKDGYTSIDRFQPYSTFLKLVADMNEINSNLGQPDDDNEVGKMKSQKNAEMIVGAVQALGESARNEIFLRNVFDVVDIFTAEPGSKTTQALRVAVRNATNAVPSWEGPTPWRNMNAAIRRQEDPYMRDARTWVDIYHNMIPGESENLAVRRNVWGDAQFYTNPLEAYYGHLWNPVYGKDFHADRVDMEIARIVAAGGSIMGMPRREQSFQTMRPTGLVDSAPVKLNSKRYEMLILLMNGKKSENSPSILKRNIKGLMGTEMYKSATDADRALMINQEISDRVAIAKEKLYSLDLELSNYVDNKTKLESEKQLQQFEERQ